MKAFLSGCAYILLRDKPEGTLTAYKEMINGTREVPMSSCPAQFSDYLYSNRKPPEDIDEETQSNAQFETMLDRLDQQAAPHKNRKKKKPEIPTRFDRIEEIKEALPGGVFSFCRVDTKNWFEHDGIWFKIDPSVKAYKPKRTKDGLLYDMDKIVVVQTPDRLLHYFDQKLNSIDQNFVHYR